MKKKKDDFYYKNLCSCIEYSYKAAEFLQMTLRSYNVDTIKQSLDAMHEIEQKADAKKHKMMAALSQAFITPIEREDLLAISDYLDDITDAIEDVLIKIYICNVRDIREDIPDMTKLLLDCVSALQDVLGELKNFKHSKKIDEYIIRVNDLEEEGDRMYIESMHRLYSANDMSVVMQWVNIYECMENCMDLCEHVADIVSTVIMKNS